MYDLREWDPEHQKIGKLVFLLKAGKPLWKLLIDSEITKTELRENIKIAPSTFTIMNNDQQVSLDVLARICIELKCGIDDIVKIESWILDN
jgi:DNA-binding Xre family transcriptional regulator